MASSTVMDQWAQYQQFLNRGAQPTPAYGTQAVEGPKGAYSGVLDSVLPTATKIGVKYLMDGGGAASGVADAAASSAAIESALSGGGLSTPFSAS
jgi:hypothetical protein